MQTRDILQRLCPKVVLPQVLPIRDQQCGDKSFLGFFCHLKFDLGLIHK